jgi:hypothetical protein
MTDPRASALALFDSISKGSAQPETTLTFSNSEITHNPGVDRPEFDSFVISKDGAIRHIDIALPFAGLYTDQEPDVVRQSFVDAASRYEYLTVFDSTSAKVSTIHLTTQPLADGWVDAEKAKPSEQTKIEKAAEKHNGQRRIALFVAVVLLVLLVTGGIVAAAITA